MAFFFVHTRDAQGKYYTLIDVPVHGEQTEPIPILVAVSVVSYDRLSKRLYFICCIVAVQIKFIPIPTVYRYKSKTIHHKRLKLWLFTPLLL